MRQQRAMTASDYDFLLPRFLFRPEVTLRINLDTATVEMLRDRVLRSKLNMIAPDVEFGPRCATYRADYFSFGWGNSPSGRTVRRKFEYWRWTEGV